MKSYSKYYLSLFFLSIFLLVGCHKDNSRDIQQTRITFDQYTNELFISEVQSDSITLNYTLESPEDYGIIPEEPSLGTFGVNALKDSIVQSENYLFRLKEFPYSHLDTEQQLTYDILEYTFSQNLSLGNYLLYPENLSKTLGIQAQLPVLLAEYHFYTKENIDQYIQLLHCIPDYFKDIIKYQKSRSKEGLFMQDYVANEVIKQCISFTSKKKDNLLITIFNEKIDSYSGLSVEEVDSYKKANEKAVMQQVIPSYELLANSLSTLKGTGKNSGGLCNFPKGKEYYEYLVRYQTGSSKTIPEMIDLLEDTIDTNLIKMNEILISNPDTYNQMLEIDYPYSDPDEILKYLKVAMEDDYPYLSHVNYTIKYVDDSLEDYLSPAFYLTPALDNYMENSIYINQSSKYDLSNIFTTLAHEGYPGHLYQCVYFNSLSPQPIRTILNFGGYSEGWATYVEMESYHLAGFPTDVASLLAMNNSSILAVSSRIDIGINYEGWTFDDTKDYLNEELGITDIEIINDFYYSLIEEPGNYLKYTIGYLELLELRKKVEQNMGEDFVLKDFHQNVLSIGPAPFSIIEERLVSLK